MPGQMFQLGKQEGVLVLRATWGQEQLLLEAGSRKSKPGETTKGGKKGEEMRDPEIQGWRVG